MLEDRRLLWRLKHGDKDALRQIYEKYENDLLKLAVVLLGETCAAETVNADTLAKLEAALPK
jgi:hypothetical protein